MTNAKTITDAIKIVMLEVNRPITAREAYEGIVERGLYDFKAQNPPSVVQSQIRKHCLGVQAPAGSQMKYFKEVGDRKYQALETPQSAR